jgi:DNA-binding NarL/FixJ family response regulator
MLIHSATKQEVSRETEAPTPAQPKAIVTSAADSSTEAEVNEVKRVLEETKELDSIDSRAKNADTVDKVTAAIALKSEGLSNYQIASALSVSEGTVRNYLKKAGVNEQGKST